MPRSSEPCDLLHAAQSPTKLVKTQNYSDAIRQTYNFRFGKDNFSLPGNAATEGNEFIPPSAFPEAEYCGHCHEEAYHQWRQALHSNSFRTPFYRASVNILIRTKGIEFSRHCDSCHNPIAVVSGGLTKDSHVDRSFDHDGLTCTTCHSIQRLQSTSGNGGYVMGVPAVMVDENGNRIPGEGSFRRNPGASRAAFQGRDAVVLSHAGILRRLPQGEPAESAQRLQVHPRFHRL